MKGERRELWIIEYNNYSSRRPSLIATSAYFKAVITSRFTHIQLLLRFINNI